MEPLSKITVIWHRQEFEVRVTEDTTVLELKEEIHKATGVQPHRQRLMNMKLRGKAPPDEYRLGKFHLRPGFKVKMKRFKIKKEGSEAPQQGLPEGTPEVPDNPEELLPIEQRPAYLAKIDRRVREYNFTQLNEFREGKRLLVLDIDYTLFDYRSQVEINMANNADELMRPYLHEFLTSAYEDYDIGIWSATSMKLVEQKMRVLGITDHSQYKIAFQLDSSAMISVYIGANFKKKIKVKPLGLIWGKFPQFSEKNTIMVDDVKNNFLMNPRNGLTIKAYRNSPFAGTREKDEELLQLSKFLRVIARHFDDFSSVQHCRWKNYNEEYP